MIKFIGVFFMFLSWMAQSAGGFDLKLSLWFLFGLFLACSQGIFNHLMFVQRERVRAKYRVSNRRKL
jgi:hypothetical protein